MEKLECDKCGTVYDDEESINLAKANKDEWEARCRLDGMKPRGIIPRLDGVKPRGIIPCPDMSCPGELILKEA